MFVSRVYKREEKRVSNYWKAVFVVQRSPDMLLYSGYDNILSICSTKHMQVNFVLQKELLQADILELDTLFSLLFTLVCMWEIHDGCHSQLLRYCILIWSPIQWRGAQQEYCMQFVWQLKKYDLVYLSLPAGKLSPAIEDGPASMQTGIILWLLAACLSVLTNLNYIICVMTLIKITVICNGGSNIICVRISARGQRALFCSSDRKS